MKSKCNDLLEGIAYGTVHVLGSVGSYLMSTAGCSAGLRLFFGLEGSLVKTAANITLSSLIGYTCSTIINNVDAVDKAKESVANDLAYTLKINFGE